MMHEYLWGNLSEKLSAAPFLPCERGRPSSIRHESVLSYIELDLVKVLVAGGEIVILVALD